MRRPTTILLPAIAGLPTAACALYCLFVWAPAQGGQFSWFNLDVSLICWTFCSTGIPALGYAAVAAGLASPIGGLLASRTAGRYILLLSGILLLPLGLLNLFVLRALEDRPAS